MFNQSFENKQLITPQQHSFKIKPKQLLNLEENYSPKKEAPFFWSPEKLVSDTDGL